MPRIRSLAARRLLFLAGWVTLLVPLGWAQGTYTAIEYPGATNTYATGIDTAGDIVGYYDDAGGQHGFMVVKGTYTALDFPGASDTIAYRLNDRGQIVGYALVNSSWSGFLYDTHREKFAPVNFPGASGTFPMAINDDGLIAGEYQAATNLTAFVCRGGLCNEIDPLNTDASLIYGVSDNNVLYGYASSQTSFFYFKIKNGVYRRFTLRDAPNGLIQGVNPGETGLTGSYNPVSGTTSAFLEQHGVLTTIEYPGYTITEGYGVNNLGQVVGRFYDTAGIAHGFLWTP